MPRQVDRNALERDRRKFMKDLLSRLAFLIPHPPKASFPELLDQATSHIKQLKQRVEMLKQRKQRLEGRTDKAADQLVSGCSSRSPMITVCDLDSILQVCLITTGLTHEFILSQLIDVLVEEAAQVVALNYSITGDTIFYTIHAQAVCSRIGIETSRVRERLEEMVSSTTY